MREVVLEDEVKEDPAPAPAILEACCDSRESVRNAVAGGASRVEVCGRGSLHCGGLTPSPTLVSLCLGECAASAVEVVALVRVRGGDFVYCREEVEEMCAEIRSLRKVGCRAFALGCLAGDGGVDLEATATCPLPVKAASSKRVLTMDYVDGVPLTDLDALRAMYGPTFDAETTLLNALNTWSLGVLSCDFFHADVHAGNLLALRDGRVAFLDFGIVGRVPERIWTSLQDAAAGLAGRDFELLAKALTTMGAAESVDERAFAADLEALFKSLDEVQPDVLVSADGAGAVAATVSVDDAQVTDLLLQVVNVTERNGIKLPREFGLLVKQALYFDRYTRLLAPDMDVINDDRVAFSAQLS